jgi:hypothetical protein
MEVRKLSKLANERIKILKDTLEIRLNQLEKKWEKISIENGLISIAEKLFYNLSDYTFSLEIDRYGNVVGKGYAIGSFLWRYKPEETINLWKELFIKSIENLKQTDKENIKKFFYLNEISKYNFAIKGLGYGIRIYTKKNNKELKIYMGISKKTPIELKAVNISNAHFELKEYLIENPFVTEVKGNIKRIQINIEVELRNLTKDLLERLKLPTKGEYMEVLSRLKKHKNILLDTISYKPEHFVLYFC